MEDALRGQNGFSEYCDRRVLILVLMEDALRVQPQVQQQSRATCLNPCSNGRCSASEMTAEEIQRQAGS